MPEQRKEVRIISSSNVYFNSHSLSRNLRLARQRKSVKAFCCLRFFAITLQNEHGSKAVSIHNSTLMCSAQVLSLYRLSIRSLR